MEPVIDMHPAEGPAGCILLRIRHTSPKGRVNEKGIGMPDSQRYWLDPKRDHIAMRWDMLRRDEKGQEAILESDTVEETARSPQGVWHATRIRRRFPSRARNGNLPTRFIYSTSISTPICPTRSSSLRPRVGFTDAGKKPGSRITGGGAEGRGTMALAEAAIPLAR
jgi:hypothetical protein